MLRNESNFNRFNIKESLERHLIESGCRTRRRVTFFCFASATAPAPLAFIEAKQKGLLPLC